jgi:hypothetical protein
MLRELVEDAPIVTAALEAHRFDTRREAADVAASLPADRVPLQPVEVKVFGRASSVVGRVRQRRGDRL